MHKIGSHLKSLRLAQSLTQMELATRAGVSLATLQNVESDQGNPALKTLDLIAQTLGYRTQLAPEKLDRNLLCILGAPLLTENERPETVSNRQDLLEHLTMLAPLVDQLKSSREENALAGFLFGLRDHFPKTWRAVDKRIQNWLEARKELYGSTIKLRRISIAQLATYL